MSPRRASGTTSCSTWAPTSAASESRSGSGFDTKSEAERGLTEALSAVDRGTYIEPSRQTLQRYLLDEWLPACAARIRPTTVESYRHLIELPVVPAIGRVTLAQRPSR